MARTAFLSKVTAAVAAVASLAVLTGPGASAVSVPAVQKITVKLSGDCADKKMVEADDEMECTVSVTVTPKSPNRSFTLQELEPGKRSKWTALDKAKSSGGKVTFDFEAMITEDEDEYYRDGAYKYRVTAIRTVKEKAFTGSAMTVTFVPDDSGDGSDDSGDDSGDSSTPTTTPTHGGTTATTPTTPGGTNGGTPTNTTAPSGPAWFAGTTQAYMGAFCMASDPYYAGATICNGITTSKTLAQFTELISPLPNAMPNFRRNSFCMQALMGSDAALTFAQRQAKCVEANAPGM